MSNSNDAPRSLLHRIGVAGSARARACQGIGASVAVLLLALLAPGVASAHFVRPYLRQITSVAEPGGVATDSANDLWVGDLAEDGLYEFSSAATGNTPLSPAPVFRTFGCVADPGKGKWEDSSCLTETTKKNAKGEPEGGFERERKLSDGPGNVAIDLSTGAVYVGAGGSGGGFEIFSEAGVHEATVLIEDGVGGFAVDNSAGASHGSVYAVNAFESPPDTLSKFDAEGKPQEFSCLKEAGPTCSEYVKGDEITGAPGATKLGGGNFRTGVAVDPIDGDIYVITEKYLSEGPAVLEYAPSGEFIHAVTSTGVPGLPSGGAAQFGGSIWGLAVDPTNGDLLVSVSSSIGLNNVGIGAVNEFDSSGHFLGQITEAEGRPLSGAQALALDSEGHLYVVNRQQYHGGGTVNVYDEGDFVPALRLAAATARTETAAVLNGSVAPESPLTPEPSEYGVSDCHFEYVTEAAFEAAGFSNLSSGGAEPCEGPAAAQIPKTNEYTPVHAAIAGLASGVTYRYRLSATLAGAFGGKPETSSALAFTAPHAPAVSATAANEITSTFADLHATVNPLGADTTYSFEYLSEAQFKADGETFGAGTEATPTVDVGAGSSTGSSLESVLAHIGGLQPATAYRFRLAADNEVAPTAGEEVVFTTQPQVTPGLPDNRAYELVTPSDKEGSEDMFRENVFTEDLERGAASESGDQFMLGTRAAFGPFPASGGNVYIFSRHPKAGDPAQAEWSYASLASPGLGVQSIDHAGAIDPFDFSKVAFADRVGAPFGQAGFGVSALIGAPGGPYATLHTDAQPSHGSGATQEETTPVGASTDLGTLVFSSLDHALAPGAEGLDAGVPALYESSGGGECSAAAQNCPLIDVKSNGELLSKCGAVLGRGGTGGTAYRAVSSDGSRVFFTAPDPNFLGKEGCFNEKTGEDAPQLYLRSGGETLPVSEPEEALKAQKRYEALYAGAAADGSRVFFTSETWLTADHPVTHDPELYEWRSEGVEGAGGLCGESSPGYVSASRGCLSRVSAPESGNAAAAVNNVNAVAADGSSVYFTAFAALAPGAEAHPAVGRNQGPVNLYRYATATAAVTYIAIVNTYDWPNNGDCAQGSTTESLCPNRDYYTTPDGRYLLFGSTQQLTSEAHNASSSCEQIPGSQGFSGTCTELYRYDAQTSSLLCVSCNPSGAVPTANALFTRSSLYNPADGPVRAMSDDGSYVFFDTPESLVPQDTNGVVDVYEWHEGHISLLSSGTSPSPSFFLGAGSDGKNVFIGTHSRLVPADTDNEGDVYDARICTAEEPCIEPSSQKEGLCEADACSHPPAAPNDATPASLTFTGPGDLVSELSPPPTKTVTKKAATKCKQGYVRKKVKKKETCVKKPKKSKPAKKSNRRAGR